MQWSFGWRDTGGKKITGAEPTHKNQPEPDLEAKADTEMEEACIGFIDSGYIDDDDALSIAALLSNVDLGCESVDDHAYRPLSSQSISRYTSVPGSCVPGQDAHT